MSWCLISSSGRMHQLEPTMMFIGREDCEILLQSHTIDKRHAVINYDQFDDVYTIKDVGSLNGTFINEARIPEQTYTTLQSSDTIRFGYDPDVYRFANMSTVNYAKQSPVFDNRNEDDLDHEGNVKEQLAQMNSSDYERLESETQSETIQKTTTTGSAFKTIQSRRSVKKIIAEAKGFHGSPLYGQPAWWGQDSAENTLSSKEDGIIAKDNRHRSDDDPAAAKPDRPNTLNLGGTEEKHFHRVSTDLKPRQKDGEKADDGELTIVEKNPKHASFTIEFKEKEKSPKMNLRGKLSRFVPQQVKERIDENGRIVEEKKILRKIEEHLDLEPERDTSGKEKFRQKKLNPSDLLAGDLSFEDDIVSPTGVDSEEIVSKIFTESRLARPRSSTGAVLDNIEMDDSAGEMNTRTAPKSSLTRSKSMPSRKRPVIRRKQPDPQKLKELAEKAEESDNVSETGTYTIEQEKEAKEEKEARKKIDEVFGIRDDTQKSDVENKTTPGKDKDVAKDKKETEQTLQKVPGTAPNPSWVSQWATQDGTELNLIDSPEDQQTRSQSKSKGTNGRLSRGESLPLERKRSPRGKRVLPPTPGTRDSPAVSLRSMTPSSQHSHYDSASEKEDLSVISDIVSPTSVPSRKLANNVDVESIDTDILLKDTQTVMAALESKLSKKREESPLDASFASSFDDYSQMSSEFDLESDLDTASTVSLADGDSGTGKPWGSKAQESKRRDSNGKKSSQSSRMSKGKSSAPPRKSDPARKSSDSGVWSRLSKPNRHKVYSKDGSVVSDCLSDTNRSDARLNRSQSLTNGADVSAVRKSRTSPTIQPRMTRTTALRKSRFGEKDRDSGSESTDVSSRSDRPSQSTKQPRKTKAQAMKERLTKATPRTGHRTKLGETDWKSETSLGGAIVQKSLENKTVSTQNLNKTSSSQNLHTRTSSMDVLRSNGPSAFKPVLKNNTEKDSHTKKSGSSWRRYEHTDNYSVSDSESTVTVSSSHTAQFRGHSTRSDDNESEPETNYRSSINRVHAYNGRHSAEIAKISSTLADDLSKMASGAATDTKGHPSNKDDLLFYYVGLLDDMFSEDTSTNVSAPSTRTSTSRSSSTVPSVDRRKKGTAVNRSTSFTLGAGEKRYERVRVTEKQDFDRQNGQRRKQWPSESFDSLVLSSIYQLSLKLKRSTQRVSSKVNYLYNQDIQSESSGQEGDIPTLKTASKELSGILSNLRKVEKKLEMIENCLDPENSISVPLEDDDHDTMQYRKMLEENEKYRRLTGGKRRSWQMGTSGEVSNDDSDKSEEYY
ncbi:uncharacterized protein LOC144450439 isoform X2 [Glandiceps talaboti]